MKILATDLDRTLLPNGSWPSDTGAIELFNELTIQNNVLVVYVTGRNLSLTEDAIREFGIRYPHVLISDVGSTIYQYKNGNWYIDTEWHELIKQNCSKWNTQAIHREIENIEGLHVQPSTHCGIFKQSYFLNHKHSIGIIKTIESRLKGNYDETFVYSYDTQDNQGLLDFLPKNASKKTALKYIAQLHNAKNADVIFCGDSGNDIAPLTADFSGVLVRNADEQLTTQVKSAYKENPKLKIYFAKGNFDTKNGKKLNGYYASGVIEGAYHYGAFDNGN